jgi:hypothetical protein
VAEIDRFVNLLVGHFFSSHFQVEDGLLQQDVVYVLYLALDTDVALPREFAADGQFLWELVVAHDRIFEDLCDGLDLVE